MAEPQTSSSPRGVREHSTPELVQQVSEQVARLVRDELTLARIELAEKGRHAGMGAGLFGGGGLIALYGLGVLFFAVVFGLAEAMPLWLAALIVGLVLVAIAGVLALVARNQVRQATPPRPEEATRGLRSDADAVSESIRSRGRS